MPDHALELSLDAAEVKKLLTFVKLHGERSFVIKELNNLEITDPLYLEGVTELEIAEVIEKFSAQGAQVHVDTPEEFAEFIAAETEKWAGVVKESGATVN